MLGVVFFLVRLNRPSVAPTPGPLFTVRPDLLGNALPQAETKKPRLFEGQTHPASLLISILILRVDHCKIYNYCV